MKIGIDARFYGPLGKGLGRYTQEVVDNVLRMKGAEVGADFEYVIFLSPENYDEFIVEAPNVKKVLLKIRWYSLREQILMPFLIWREHLDLIHFPHFNVPIFTPVKFVVTIHDLILTHFPTIRATTKSKFFYYLKNLAYQFVISIAIRRAQYIISVSEFTKNDIISKFKVRADKIKVTYEGVANLAKGRDSLFVLKLDNQETLAEYHIANNYLLYVGNAYPHKNLETLIHVFSKIHSVNPELRLVMVGREDFFYLRVQDYARSLNLWQKGNINSPIIFPGYVPDAQLEILYLEAQAYVFPSLYEGFGLPPLEAMARSCPVLSSNRSSMPEILKDAALYFDPENEEDMIAKINLILQNNQLRNDLIIRGLEMVKKYNWWECAHQTLLIYQEALKIRKK